MIENPADGFEHRAGFGGNVAEHREAPGEVGCDQPGQESVAVVHEDLAERSRGSGYRVRLDAGQGGVPGFVSQ